MLSLKNFSKIPSFIKSNFSYFIIGGYSLLVLFLMIKINIFRYEDFGQGKFDLGNMTQMAWYSLRGKFMFLTDYFGSNVPRWSMSHVDPILVLFLPLFYLIPHPLTLVFSQNILVILGAFIIYRIAKLKTHHEFFSVCLALAYLTYPALGFVLAWTGYHGVTPAIFFFLLFIYFYEKVIQEGRRFKLKDYVILIVLMTITMMGKEQISLYFVMFGVYAFLTSNFKKFAVAITIYSVVWFLVCFVVIIPHYASYRIDSFEKFVTEMGINKEDVPNIYSANYFLSRYSEFGDSYFEIVKNMALNPVKTSSIFLTGDKINNLISTFGPVLYLCFLNPLVLMLAFPDLLINYSTTQGGIGTSEIYNHRISMIIPVVFLATAYGVGFLRRFLKNYFYDKYLHVGLTVLGVVLYLTNLYFSAYAEQKNPLFAWFSESITKKVLAKSDTKVIKKDLKVGDSYALSPYIENDRGCVKKILNIIPPMVSVSGPDFMGSHLAQRETYAIFPAGKSTSDYLIVDIFSKKLLTILGLSYSLNRDYMEDVFKSKNYNLIFSCSNLMVFRKAEKNVIDTEKLHLLPVQTFNKYEPMFNYKIFRNVNLVATNFNEEALIGGDLKITNVYQREDSSDLSSFNLFTSIVHKESGEMYQFVNYPTVVFKTVDEFKKGKYYEEKMEIKLPEYLEKGKYMIFVGLDNRIKSQSVYIGDVELK